MGRSRTGGVPHASPVELPLVGSATKWHRAEASQFTALHTQCTVSAAALDGSDTGGFYGRDGPARPRGDSRAIIR